MGECFVHPTSIIDDTAGDGDTDKVWSADKLADGFALKADAENPVFIDSISMGRNEFTVPGLNSVATGDISSIYPAFYPFISNQFAKLLLFHDITKYLLSHYELISSGMHIHHPLTT